MRLKFGDAAQAIMRLFADFLDYYAIKIKKLNAFGREDLDLMLSEDKKKRGPKLCPAPLQDHKTP